MRVDILTKNSDVLGSIRQNLSASSPADTSRDALISLMSPDEAFDRFVTWNNCPGWGPRVRRLISLLDRCERPDGTLDYELLSEEDNDGIIEHIRLRNGFADYDDTFDGFMAKLSASKALEDVLAWNGIIGFSPRLTAAYRLIQSAKN